MKKALLLFVLIMPKIQGKLPARFSADFVITQEDVPFVIRQEGVYQLAEEIVGTGTAIVIDADNVVLDLNGQIIRSSFVSIQSENRSDIIIQNGFIEEGTIGINLDSCVSVGIRDIHFFGSANGITIDNCQEVTLNNCNLFNHTTTALLIDNSNTVQVFNCVASFNETENVFLLQNSSNLLFEEVEASNNEYGAAGFAGSFSGNGLQTSIFKNCRSFNNNNSLAGATGSFLFQGSQNITCQECFSVENTHVGLSGGFIFFGANSDEIRFIRCISNNNISSSNLSIGFLLVGTRIGVIGCIAEANIGTAGFGILASSSADSTIIDNIVASNGGTGISNSSATSTVFRNISMNHTANYAGTAVPIVTYDPALGTFSATPTPFDNISVI